MNRNITGTIRKTDGAVWAEAVVEFELERSSYDEQAQYPIKPVRVVADADGEFTIALWVNKDAPRPARYICTLPDGSQFRFILPEGDGAVDLNELRENAVEDDSPGQSDLLAFLPLMRQEAREVVEGELNEISAEIATKADQSALDATNADLLAANAAIAIKANQTALNHTNSNVLNATVALENLTDVVDTKASQSSLDATNADLSAANAAIATKANQTALNHTNTNVQTLTDGLADLGDIVDTKASQSALDTANAELQSITNNLADLSDVVDTKAAQSALESAIGDLQDAIALAQNTLLDLINQKAPISHTHASGDIEGEKSNAVAFFDDNGILTSSNQLAFFNGKFGLGTAEPDFTLDLRHPEAVNGNQSRLAVNLNSPSPDLQLISDPHDSQAPRITLDCAGAVNFIESDSQNILSLGQEGSTPGIAFRLLTGVSYFRGLWVDEGTISTPFDEPGSFGFNIDPHGDEVKLVVNVNGSLRSVTLKTEGGIFL